MSNLCNKFVVFQIRPADSCKPFLANGTSYRNTFILSHFGDGDDTYGGCPGAFDERIVPSAKRLREEITNCVPCGVRKQPPRWSQESATLTASRPRGEAQAVCARITLNPLFATIVSWQ